MEREGGRGIPADGTEEGQNAEAPCAMRGSNRRGHVTATTRLLALKCASLGPSRAPQSRLRSPSISEYPSCVCTCVCAWVCVCARADRGKGGVGGRKRAVRLWFPGELPRKPRGTLTIPLCTHVSSHIVPPLVASGLVRVPFASQRLGYCGRKDRGKMVMVNV